MVLLQRTNLAVFYQDAERGFSKEADLSYGLSDKPTLIWPARVGLGADSLLLMTSEGVSQLRIAGPGSMPVLQAMIRQPTAIPPRLDESAAPVIHFPLSLHTGADSPLVLVPVQGAIQVWRHRNNDGWQIAQTLERAASSRLSAVTGSHPGYSWWLGLDLGVCDVNGDGRDDLMLRRQDPAGIAVFTLFLQTSNALFGARPALTYETKPDWRSWFGWVDLNGDGRADLIKTTWLNEPWFVPGVRSGKVLVGVHLADANGTLPAEPQQVFRKNDWTPALPVPDIDGDGFPDLALGFSLFDSREGARKMMTARQLDFSLRFHFYRRGNGFSKEPDCQRDAIIRLDQHSLHLSWDRRDSFERFVSLDGDFNGDRKRDLLIRDASDHVSIYYFISREKGFTREARLRFGCPEPIDALETRDLNSDGASDLIISLQKRNAFRIFLSELR